MKKTTRLLIAVAALLALLLVQPAFGGLRANLNANTVDFAIDGNTQYHSVSLRVSGMGKVVDQTFGADEALVFAPSEYALPDGSYSFEATVNIQRPEGRGDGEDLGPVERIATYGYFNLVGGTIADARAEEPIASVATPVGNSDGIQSVDSRDQQILDDLIVDGSACVGQDCVNGESFGFDTIRIKENNLRIKAQDTSSTASFPTQDWQLTFNDSTNGGANKFSVDCIAPGSSTPFTIEGCAPSHSLYVDDGGRVGFGTSTPVADLHVKSGNTPTLRLEQDGSSGFTAQTWDLAGNEANLFIRDASNGSTLPFRIFPNAPSNALTIEASTGDIGLGTTSPDASLDIEASGPSMKWTNTGPGAGVWEYFVNANTARLNLRFGGGNIPFKIDDISNDNLFRIGQTIFGAEAANVVSIGDNQNVTEAVLQVYGSVEVDGVEVHADYVFEDDYALKSIEEQAAFMWQNKHLPALPKAPEGLRGPVDLVGHQMGMLEELEKAHIYIEQLHGSIAELTARLEKLEAAADDE